MIGVGLSLPQVAVRRVAAAASGPTVILDAAYRTDTLLDQGLVPITNGGELDSWAMATGGTFNYETAFLAGASARPIWLLGTPGPGGVHTAGNNAALTCATPVTIPAATDFVAYLKLVMPASASACLIGNSAAANRVITVETIEGEVSINFSIDGSNYAGVFSSTDMEGTKLYRFRRSGSTLYIAATGLAESSASVTGAITGAAAFDTLLGYSSTGSGLTGFAASGCYLQKAYIFHGSSTADTTYETNNGGVLS
mgnify:CR=1 FL=1